MSKLRGSLGVVLPKFHCEASVDGAKGVLCSPLNW